MFRGFVCLHLLLTCLCAEAPRWQLEDSRQGWSDEAFVLEYFHHSEMQRQWSWELMGSYPLRRDERVLDFGSGDGKVTAELSHCVPQGCIVGVDISQEMVSFARRTFSRDYYPNLSFTQLTDLNFEEGALQDLGTFDRIVSFSVFHLIKNPKEVLRNLRKRIHKEGVLCLVFPNGGNRVFFQAAQQTFEDFGLPPPWVDTPRCGNEPTMRTVQGVRAILEASHWRVSHLKQIRSPYVFVNRDEFVHWLIGTLTANWGLDMEIAADFFHRVVAYMEQMDPTLVDTQGSYHYFLSRIQVVADPV